MRLTSYPAQAVSDQCPVWADISSLTRGDLEREQSFRAVGDRMDFDYASASARLIAGRMHNAL
jgi:hypothetical protein